MPHQFLGKTYRDAITGFRGIATARVEYLTGCAQVCLTPLVGADGKVNDGLYIDEMRLQEQEVPAIVLQNKGEAGGFHSEVPDRQG